MTTLYTGTSPLPVIEVGMRLRDGWGCVWRVVEVHDGGLTVGLQSAREGCVWRVVEVLDDGSITIGLQSAREGRVWLDGASVRVWRLDEDWTTEAV